VVRQDEAAEGSEAESILDLQARAGNRAVSELLSAREGAAPVPVQRDTGDEKTGAEASGAGKVPSSYTMSIPQLELTVPIESVQQASGPRGGDTNRAPTPSGEVIVTVSADNLDQRLVEAAMKGRPFATITIAIGTATITLHNVVISSFQMGTGSATLQLNAQSIDYASGEGGATKSEPSPTG
jgi:hypothetical protein